MPIGLIKKIGRKLFSDEAPKSKPVSESKKSAKKPGLKQRGRRTERPPRPVKITVIPGDKGKHGEEWVPGGGDAVKRERRPAAKNVEQRSAQAPARRDRSSQGEQPREESVEGGERRQRPRGRGRRGRDSRREPQNETRGETRREAPAATAAEAAPKRSDVEPGRERARSEAPRSESERPRSRKPEESGGEGGSRKPQGERRSRSAGHAEAVPDMSNWSLDDFQVPEVEGKVRFHDLDLPLEVMRAVADQGFEYCTPIQAESLAHSLKGENVAGQAQTGTGKTAAFLLAVLSRFLRDSEGRPSKSGTPRALIIAPTRELVIQIASDAQGLGKFCNLRCLAVYGGMDYNRQQRDLAAGPVDLLVATPGRLLDFQRQRIIDLSQVDTLVIDEADRMLDMGFIPDVRRIIGCLPHRDKRCTTLYSATLNDAVMRLAAQWMPDPVVVKVEPEQVAVDTVKQLIYTCRADEKFSLLYNLLMHYADRRVLVFCNRRIGAQIAADRLERRGVKCAVLSGAVAQKRRLNVLEEFREGSLKVVVATDVAGRGIHVDDIGLVINYDFPYEAEDYVHRIGRTGRAGAEGTAVSFACEDESFIIPEIEAFIKDELKCVQPEESLLVKAPKASRPPAVRHDRGGRGGGRGGYRGGGRGGYRGGGRGGARGRSRGR